MAKRSYRKKSGKRSKRSPRKGSRKSGRRTKRRSTRRSKRSRIGSRKIKKSPCAKYNKNQCGSVDPNCGWVKKRGCSRKRGAASGSVYEGPSFQPFGSEVPALRMRRRSRR
jgi:hypothetical protein